MSSELFKRDSYLTPDIDCVFGTDIYEYDMHHAGISISREFNLLLSEELDKIEKKAKNKKDVATLLGLVQRSNPEYRTGLAEGFVKARKLFFEANNLEDEQIISIKKDAIFTTCLCDTTKFGLIEFRKKHHYTSFMKVDRLELYYSSDDDSLDIKGINDTDLEPHEEYMMKFIKKYFNKMEFGMKEDTKRFIRSFVDQYKKLELDPGYYRSFDRNHYYTTWDGSLEYTEIGPELLPTVDISYNFNHVITPMLMSLL